MTTGHRPVRMSATLAADEMMERRRRAGEPVLQMTSGEIGLPAPAPLCEVLAGAAGRSAYGPVAGSSRLRAAAAEWWRRRHVPADPDLVVAGPGSKALLFATLLAAGGDVALPCPSWVSYAAQADLAGLNTVPVRTPPGEGGVPDPEVLRAAAQTARRAGRRLRAVVLTVPDNPTGAVASPKTVAAVCGVARDLDLVVISDEIYGDLVFDGSRPPSPAHYAPERTVVTTGLTKSLAVGGWRTGVARFPEGALGQALHERVVGVASQVWSSPPAPVQEAVAYALDEPSELVTWTAAARNLHGAVARAVAERFIAAGSLLRPVRATCYLYPDFELQRERLARGHGVRDGPAVAALLLARYGVGLLPASAFGEADEPMRLRVSTSRLYGDTDEQRRAALDAADPLDLPWIRASLDRVEHVLADLTGGAPGSTIPYDG